MVVARPVHQNVEGLMNKVIVQQEVGKRKAWDVVKCPLAPLWYVAERLGVSEKTVERLSQLGKLPPKVKVGHLSRMDWREVCKFYPGLGEGMA